MEMNEEYINERFEFDEVLLRKLELDTSIESNEYDTAGLSLYQNNDVAAL